MVIAATKVIVYAAPPSYWPKFVHPLMRLLMTSKEVERVVIVDLIIITKSAPVSCCFLIKRRRVSLTMSRLVLAPVLALLYSLFGTIVRFNTSEEGQNKATSQCAYD